MILIDSVMTSLKELIVQEMNLSDLSVKLSYEKNLIANPIRKTYIILNPSKIKITPYRDEYGALVKKSEYKVTIKIHRAEATDPTVLLSVFSELLNALGNSGIFDIEESGCGEISSDQDTNSIYLPGYIQFSIIG